MITLDLRDLKRFTSLRSAALGTFEEAARVMFFTCVPKSRRAPGLQQGPAHASFEGSWTNDGASQPVEVVCEVVDPEQLFDELAAHANELDATEAAAYAVAFAVADQLGFRVVARLHHGSGADWVMVPRGEPSNDYHKLEVSGIARKSATNPPEARLRQKVTQGSAGDLDRPGVAVVARIEDALILSESWR